MLRKAWAHRWGIAITAQMVAAGAAGYLTGPQTPAQTWLYRAVLAEAIAGITWFVVTYSRMHGWRSHLGQTILVVKMLLLGSLVPAFLFLFFRLSRMDSHIVSGINAAMLSAIGLAMAWRRAVWAREATVPDETEARLTALVAENERLADELALYKKDHGED